MAGGTGRVGKRFQFTFLILLGDFCGADLVEFGHGCADATRFAQNADLKQACIYRAGQVGDLFELSSVVSLAFQGRKGSNNNVYVEL